MIPCRYVTIASYAHDTLLRSSGVELSLTNDVSLYNWYESALRGGLSVVNVRSQTSNHSYLPQFNEASDFCYMDEHDAINQYGEKKMND